VVLTVPEGFMTVSGFKKVTNGHETVTNDHETNKNENVTFMKMSGKDERL
jgi:hypothetical protein